MGAGRHAVQDHRGEEQALHAPACPLADAIGEYGRNRGWKKDNRHEGRLVARFGSELHVDFAERVIEALDGAGVTIEPPETPRIDASHDHWTKNIGKLEKRERQLRLRIKGARELRAEAVGDGDRIEAAEQKATIDEAKRELNEVMRELGRLRERSQP